MTNFKSLTIWTIVLNFFVFVGAGHGIGCIGLFEIIFFVYLLRGDNMTDGYFTLSMTESYDNSLGAVVLFSLAGQLLIIISFRFKKQIQYWTKLTGLLLLWIGFYYLTHNIFNDDSLSLVSFFSGTPFIFISILLFYKMTKQELQIKDASG